jgi:Putative Flp pilus-assembly TadE/G-like
VRRQVFRRLNLRSDRGQSLITFLIALPVLLAVAALVIDGANAFAQKRKAQGVADATALAAAQSIISGDPPSTCPAGGPPLNDVPKAANCYSRINDGPFGPDLNPCTEYDPAAEGYRPDPGEGCYASPYIDKNGISHDGKVEVRVTRPIGGFFLDAIGIGSIFGKGAFARAVASATQTTETVCDYSNPVASPPTSCEIPGSPEEQGTLQPPQDEHCTFDPPVDNPDQYLTTTPPCTIPGTDPVTGNYQPAQDEHCTFDPPVDNPDQYLTTDPPCTIPGTDPIQGTYEPAEAAHCIFDPEVDNPDQYLTTDPPCTIPGKPSVTGTYHAAVPASCEFNPPVDNPDQYLTADPPCTAVVGGLEGAVAFVMSRECDAISYNGAGGGTVGSLVTNGGIWFSGSAPKRVERLGYDQAGCPTHPDRPPSGTGACTDPANSNKFLCVKELLDFGRVPMNWPVPPPPEPSPLPSSTTWDPSIHYPSSCIDLGTTNVTFTPASGPAGIYCLRGGATLTLNGDFTNGDGYTFFALGGGRILISSNGTKVTFYWPSSCGARPPGRPASFACFGRTISGYDPQTLLYATNTTHSATCENNAICINGQDAILTGDMFAVAPGVFPPPDRSP